MMVPDRSCARDRAAENKSTMRQVCGVASLRPIACVVMMPMTIANCVRTPGPYCQRERLVDGDNIPTAPWILVGAISDRNIGPTHSPKPAPTPTSTLHAVLESGEPIYARHVTHRPIMRAVNDAEKPRTAEPNTNIAELAWTAPFRPQRSMMTFATKLPRRPPTVYTAVTTENVESDIGMHFGKP